MLDRRGATDKKLPLAVIAAYLRLGKKYEITQLHTEALDILQSEFPSSLAEFHQSGRSIRIANFKLATIVGVINLARETRTHVVLPAAFYDLCDYGTDIQGIMMATGQGSQDSPDSPSLSSHDRLLVALGGHRLLGLKIDVTYAWKDSAYDDTPVNLRCSTHQSCIAAIKSAFFNDISFSGSRYNALISWEDIHWDEPMCHLCVAQAKRKHDEGRARVWDRLPGIFGLPDWPELLKE